MKSTFAAGILAGILQALTGLAWSGPVVVEVPVGVNAAPGFAVPVMAPGFARQTPGGATLPLGKVGSVRVQPGLHFDNAAPVSEFAPAASQVFSPAESMVEPAVSAAFETFTNIVPSAVANLSAESAWQKGGEQFDFNFSAKKAVPGPAPVVAPAAKSKKKAVADATRAAKRKAAPVNGSPEPKRPPKTLRDTGKTETSKGRLPIHRPEEGQSTYEPGLFSPSRLGEFEWNKDDYAFHWIFRHKRDVPKVVEAFLGGIVHQSFENVNKWLKGGATIDQISEDDVVETFNTLWEEQYEDGKHKMPEDLPLPKGMSADEKRKVAEKMIKERGIAYIRSVFQRLRPMYAKVASGEVKLVFIEQKMFFTLREESSGKTYRFQGIPDLVIMYEENGQRIIEVTDYKTTLNPPGLDQLMKKEYQLTMYADAIEQNFPELAKGAKFMIRYNYKDFPHVFEATPEFRRVVRERVLTILHEIEVFTAQVEANREEWERRINPNVPPRKLAEATKLVDQWTKLHWKMDTLNKEYKKLEAEADGIMERLLAFAKATGKTVIPGRIKDAVLDEKENVKAPTKSEDEEGYDALVALIKKAGLWEEFSSLNLAEIKKVAKVAGHPHHALYEKIKHLVVVGMKQEMKLKEKSDKK